MHIHSEKIVGFDIDFYALQEYDSPKDHFDDWVEVCDKIESGEYVWFCAKVTASKNGIVLASEYLGCCCYDSYQQFILDSDYYADMIVNVVSNATSAISNLIKE